MSNRSLSTNAEAWWRVPLRSVSAPLSALAFWAAIALPALYLPLLVTGLETGGELAVFLGLFGLHVGALLGGRSYGRD